MINKAAVILSLIFLLCLGLVSTPVFSANGDDSFTTDFRLEDCRFTPWGVNPYFILMPGYQLVLEGQEDEEEIQAAQESR